MEIEREEFHECEDDTARIDFLELYLDECVVRLGNCFYFKKGFGHPNFKAKTLREAVDGAINLRMSSNGL